MSFFVGQSSTTFSARTDIFDKQHLFCVPDFFLAGRWHFGGIRIPRNSHSFFVIWVYLVFRLWTDSFWQRVVILRSWILLSVVGSWNSDKTGIPKKYRYCLHVSVSLDFYVPLLSHTSSNTAKLNNDLPPGHFQNARRIAWPQWDCKRLSVMVIKICVGNRHKQNLCLVGRTDQATTDCAQTKILERLCHSSRTQISWLLFLSVTVFSH